MYKYTHTLANNNEQYIYSPQHFHLTRKKLPGTYSNVVLPTAGLSNVLMRRLLSSPSSCSTIPQHTDNTLYNGPNNTIGLHTTPSLQELAEFA